MSEFYAGNIFNRQILLLTMRCPLCQTELPDDARDCTRCDWVRQTDVPELKFEDWCAAGLSIVPGLGHLYKGHLLPGALIFLVLGPIFLALVLVLAPATLGVSLLLPAVFVCLVAADAFHLPNAREYPGVRAQMNLTMQSWLRPLMRK